MKQMEPPFSSQTLPSFLDSNMAVRLRDVTAVPDADWPHRVMCAHFVYVTWMTNVMALHFIGKLAKFSKIAQIVY
jgi:5-deoxy-D-glucuronate isomerase